ncbi:hypothetical protein [Microbacterium sp. UFMG61]|uniref:hypothetical protein n=1 Tax=Microbacterium sp. UFMG61 TaxID=2745935 RepID=UPI00188F7E71|nr:hypothetical protein [Microbacterium sp. UFMG61]
MDQTPVQGQEALAPPSADIAQRYLDEADAVVHRRGRVVDRRAQARLHIANAVITAAYLVAMAAALRGDGGGTSQVILFSFLLWGQLASGMAQRSGVQWRLTASRWPLLLAGGVLIVAALVVFGFVVWDPEVPAIGMWIPAALVLFGFGGYGAVRLARASGDPHTPRSHPAPLPRGARWGTVLVGIVIGVLAMLGSAPDGVLTSVLILLVVLMLVAWMAAARTEMGLPTVGASWRWPHLAAFAASACTLSLVVLLDGVPVVVGVLGGLGIIALLTAVSFVSGRDLRD